MLKTVIIAENILDPSTWITLETDDVLATLQQKFDKFPDTARIYNGSVCKANDITPGSEDEVNALNDYEGPFHVMVYPEGIEYVAYFLIAAIVVAAIVFKPSIPNSLASTRNIQSASPNNALSGRTNQIRINGRIPDIYGTVNSTPDLIAVPYTVFVDHIEREYCFMCIGRGAYEFPGNVPRVRDGQTLISEIEGSSLEIFGPDTSPNTGDIPQLRIGDAITRPVISVVRSKSVNGQVLLATNDGDLGNFNNLVGFYYPQSVLAIDSNPVDLTTTFAANNNLYIYTGDVLASPGFNPFFFALAPTLYNVRFNIDGRIEFSTVSDLGGGGSILGADGYAYMEITNAIVTDGVTSVDLSGRYIATGSGNTMNLQNPTYTNADFTDIAGFAISGGWTPFFNCRFQQPAQLRFNFTGQYQITSDPVTPKAMKLVNPGQVNSSWAWLARGIDLGAGDSAYGADGVAVSMGVNDGADNWVGPFTLDVPTMNEVICNFVALQGMYKDNGTIQISTFVDIQVGATPVDSSGIALAAEQYFGVRIDGSATKRDQRAATLFGALSPVGRYKVRARRITPKDLGFVGQIADEVKWRDLYASSPVGQIAFGDITTVHSLTQATAEALAVSERQINILVSRKIPLWLGGSSFSAPTATNSAAEIFCRIAIDVKLGRRKISEVNFAQIFATLDEVLAYFGNVGTGEFCYTFDNDNMSPEEMLSVVAQAVFCTANRRGNVLEWKFERATDDSILLFNHRNKIPNTENRSLNFGNVDDNDGIEYEYVSPDDDALITYYIPEDRTAVKPRKVQSVGVRNFDQAYIHAYREYNRQLHQCMSVEFEATQEADELSVDDRILVADNTRPDTQDGEIEAQEGLILTLSQPAVFKQGVLYIIFLQYISGIVESIGVTKTADPYKVLLAETPSEALVLDDAKAARTTYILTTTEDGANNAFLITEKEYPQEGNFRAKLTAINYNGGYYATDKDRFVLIDLLLHFNESNALLWKDYSIYNHEVVIHERGGSTLGGNIGGISGTRRGTFFQQDGGAGSNAEFFYNKCATVEIAGKYDFEADDFIICFWLDLVSNKPGIDAGAYYILDYVGPHGIPNCGFNCAVQYRTSPGLFIEMDFILQRDPGGADIEVQGVGITLDGAPENGMNHYCFSRKGRVLTSFLNGIVQNQGNSFEDGQRILANPRGFLRLGAGVVNFVPLLGGDQLGSAYTGHMEELMIAHGKGIGIANDFIVRETEYLPRETTLP